MDHTIGKPVENLQSMLRLISQEDTHVLPVIPNGFFGRSTYASVRSFQQAAGLPDTGIVDSATWDAIVELYNQVYRKHTSPTIRPVWDNRLIISPGESSNHIYLLQAMLTALAKTYPEIPVPEFNGILNPATAAGLQIIQTSGGIMPTGALNTETWHLVTALYETISEDRRTAWG